MRADSPKPTWTAVQETDIGQRYEIRVGGKAVGWSERVDFAELIAYRTPDPAVIVDRLHSRQKSLSRGVLSYASKLSEKGGVP